MMPPVRPTASLGGEFLAQVPYIHCPECRLTVYGGTAYQDRKRCPRCGTEMSQSPRPLFRAALLDARKSAPPPRTDRAAGGRA